MVEGFAVPSHRHARVVGDERSSDEVEVTPDVQASHELVLGTAADEVSLTAVDRQVGERRSPELSRQLGE